MRLPSSGLVIALTLVVVAVVEFSVEELIRQHELRREQEHTLSTLNGVRARIEKLIYRDLYVVRALATHIAASPDIDQAGFSSYVEQLLRKPTALRHVTAAPNLTIRFMHPLGPATRRCSAPTTSRSPPRAKPSTTPSCGEP
ncbi:MAG: hypothetical protein IPM80_03685 [Proteobacteria bacterium]|nr:hypothetical protein [Pseudomonadota bacterium]